MHISEIGFCSGHSVSGVSVDEFARTTLPGLHAAGEMASVPHNHVQGAFSNGAVAGEHAAEQDRSLDPTRRDDRIPLNQIESKVRRMVNDYLQAPKVAVKYQLGQEPFADCGKTWKPRRSSAIRTS